MLITACSAPPEPAAPLHVAPVAVAPAATSDASTAPSDEEASTPVTRPSFAVLRALPGIDVLESENHARHVHGGAAASIGAATIRVRVRDTRPHSIVVTRLALLRGHCRETTWSDRRTLTPVGYEVHDWDHHDPLASEAARATVPGTPDLYAVTVRFAPVDAYQACDRFAFDVQLDIDGTPLELELPLHVMRFEPLRRP
jgi:hypothetical protein